MMLVNVKKATQQREGTERTDIQLQGKGMKKDHNVLNKVNGHQRLVKTGESRLHTNATAQL